MRARQLRAFRGASAAGVATFLAAVSHTIGGGSAPNLAIVLGVTTIAWPITTALVGRRLRAGGLAAAVIVAQVVLHVVFAASSGAASSAGDASMAGMHQHGGTAVFATALATGGTVAQLVLPSASMLGAHGLAAIASFVLLFTGERMLRAIVGWTMRLLRRAIVAAPRFDRRPRPVVAGVRMAHRSHVRGPVRRRGPPLEWGDLSVA